MAKWKVEGRRESGVEGKLSLSFPHLRSRSCRFLVISSAGLCLELALCFVSISSDKGKEIERQRRGEEENGMGSSAPCLLTHIKPYVGGTTRGPNEMIT